MQNDCLTCHDTRWMDNFYIQIRLSEVLESPNHRWYLGKMSPDEAARRKKAAEDFKARFK